MFFLWQSKMNQDRNVTIGTTFFTFKSKRRNVAVLLLHLCFYQIFLSGEWPSSRAHTELIIILIWRMSILHSPCNAVSLSCLQTRGDPGLHRWSVSRVQTAPVQTLSTLPPAGGGVQVWPHCSDAPPRWWWCSAAVLQLVRQEAAVPSCR